MPPLSRKAPCRCGSGRQYRSCCFARDRAREDGAAAALVAHQMIDGVVRVTLAQIESAGERRLACAPGCSDCCSYFIRTSRVEALPIAAFLLEPAHAAALARFAAAYPRWRAAADPDVSEIEELLRRHHGPPTREGADLRRWHQLATDLQLRELPCPLLDDDGSCGVYAVRPVVCRAWNVTGTSEHCRASSPQPAAVVEDPAIDDAVARARGLLVQAGGGLPSPDDAALPTQVARALADLRS